jgi:hypothetical protein
MVALASHAQTRPRLDLLLRVKFAWTLGRRLNRGQAMADKSEALRDVEYFNDLIANETDENRRIVLLRLLAEAEKLRQEEGLEETKGKKNLGNKHRGS